MIFAFSGLELDEELFELRKGAEKVPVQPKVLTLLFFLVRHRERVAAKHEVLEGVWADAAVSEASLVRAVHEARRAIGDDDQTVITTVRGRGFRFTADVREITRGTPTPRAQPVAPGPLPAASPTRAALVGRDAVLGALAARFDDARAGRGGMALVSGEQGIGKSRVVDELENVARARGATVLVARCAEAPGSPPYWPWVPLVRLLASRAGAEAFARDAAPLLPESDAGAAPTAEARFRAHDAVVTRLAALAATAPVLVVFEDAHLADEASVALLAFVARGVRDARVLVVATACDPPPPAATSSARASREKNASAVTAVADLAVPLRGLTEDEVARAVLAMRGAAPSARLASLLHEKSGGNPLLLSRLVQSEWAERALVDPSQTLPSHFAQPQLLESIGRHLEDLSDECRALLTLASLLGREFDVAPLAAAARLPTDVLLARLGEAERGRVIQPTKNGKWRFGHALVRDLLYARLGEADKVARHGEVAAALTAHYGSALDAHAAEVARHYVRSAATPGHAARAVELSLRAAELAAVRGARDDVARHHRDALTALSFLPHDDRRPAVQLGLARALADVGRVKDARDAYVEAAMLARALRRPLILAEAALGCGALAPADPAFPALAREAFTALEASADPRAAELRARLAKLAPSPP